MPLGKKTLLSIVLILTASLVSPAIATPLGAERPIAPNLRQKTDKDGKEIAQRRGYYKRRYHHPQRYRHYRNPHKRQYYYRYYHKPYRDYYNNRYYHPRYRYYGPGYYPYGDDYYYYHHPRRSGGSIQFRIGL